MAERNSPPTSQNPVVKNQPPPFEDVNLFASDCVFREAVAREGGSAGLACGALCTKVDNAAIIARAMPRS
jgi:hypothetical protein